ncbi:hypothetical protein EDD86DRAFT_243610 [Gorgonomyces haynaldii]|nr:hypothetical protein EDD86DRAFT_243610 [Gorgonomyces haynaldii]
MVSKSFAYVLAGLHLVNLLACIPILIAFARRIAMPKKKNLVFAAMVFATIVVFIFHIIQLSSILIIVPSRPNEALDVILDGADQLVNPSWCAFDALVSSIFATSSMVLLGVVLIYIPFAIFLATRYRISMPLVLPAAVLAGIYGGLAINLPPSQQFTLCDWHCTANYKSVPAFGIIVVVFSALCGLTTASLAAGAVYMMFAMRKEATKSLGGSNIPGDLIIRSIGASCLMIDFIVASDSIINLLYPSVGLDNGVLRSFLGGLCLFLWGTTNDLVDLVPWIQPQMKYVQLQMLRVLPTLDSESMIAHSTPSGRSSIVSVKGDTTKVNTSGKLDLSRSNTTSKVDQLKQNQSGGKIDVVKSNPGKVDLARSNSTNAKLDTLSPNPSGRVELARSNSSNGKPAELRVLRTDDRRQHP